MSRLRSWIVPAYLLLAIILGGSAQGVWGNLALQLIGIALIGFCAAFQPAPSGPWLARLPVMLLMAALVVIAVQLVPLPPGVWTGLPGRGAIVEGFRVLGQPLPSLPLSLAPYQTLVTAFWLIPPIAVFVGVRNLAPEPRRIAIAIVGGTVLAILLGAVQAGGGEGGPAYPYANSSVGAVGFFANRNHMATLLLVAIPAGAALLGTSKSDRRSSAGRYGIGIALLLLLLVAIALNGSLAVYLLALPILLASVTLLPAAAAWRRFALPVTAVALVAGIAVLATRPVSVLQDRETSRSVDSRSQIWATTNRAIADSFPAGTGLGTFEQVYRQYEDPAQVTPSYVNHAHNDYLELVLELGLAGLILMAVFVGWWAFASVRVWTSQLSAPFARAATIASAAILVHSVVDFPARTAAIACILAACIALIAGQFRPAATAQPGQRRSARHVSLG
ncbi:O-antigen ligase family protein [Sphingomonas sabuli]|uniref:O-antigen ligase family protein n=1 Tax=Sphingomonas sabuli TaxID=2764186 RepID=A0A7G9L4K5_9SPHN|nr:O-antigen ligase family protein [Sphingomonas sabuli]QNM83554.1 O-antigen ligase family protein [Sphingomonas sabuli]